MRYFFTRKVMKRINGHTNKNSILACSFNSLGLCMFNFVHFELILKIPNLFVVFLLSDQFNHLYFI